MKKYFIIPLIFFALLVVSHSCTKDFEEINTDPNNPVEAPSINILANVIRLHTQQYYNAWGDMNEPSSYANHLGKIQYIDEAAYRFREGVVNNLWFFTYVNINDLDIVIRKESQEGGNPNYLAMAMTLRAYIYQMATDRWKDIPYTDAARGHEELTNPSYDTQESIYMDLLDQLKQANNHYDNAAVFAIGPNDVLFGGNMMKWKRFTNSLRLRVATRMSDVAPAVARQHIEEILANPSTYPVMLNNADNAYLIWQSSPPYKEPWNTDSDNRDDHGMCVTLIDILKDHDDPRLPVYAKPATVDGEYRGVISGTFDGTFALNEISRIGARFRDVPDGFTPIMRAAEIHFMIAEAAFRGWNTGGISAQQAYEDGIAASLSEYDLDGLNDYLAQPGVAWNNSANQIHLQKWIALFKNGNEAWAENRRTDVPLLEHAPASAYVDQHNRPPFRYPYPVDEINLNSENVGPKLQGIVNHMWGQRMWWDTRTGVN
ncbi:MAG: SusD/RagB family nutrient-binding outer membrane lipoprotein [Bacteroidetes bacterium]|nr:MAG: SusD/RagB family nutrient-binding outer membrane lipoprotein [Bacteroidota bacterium]